MSNQAFAIAPVSSLAIQNQPSGAGSGIYLRSTLAADGGQTFHVYGTVGGVPGGFSSDTVGNEEVASIGSTFTAITHATLDDVGAGTISAYQYGTAAVGDVTGLTNPADGATLTIGLAGSVFNATYRFKNTLAAAYDVKIGATVQDTMAHLAHAINLDGTPGTDYYTGTAANWHVTATVNTSVVTITDRIPCNRQLTWVLTESASNFAKRVPRDGVDGLLLFSFPIGSDYVSIPVTFAAEDGTTITLPANMTGVSSPVAVGGSAAMLRIHSTQNLTVSFESSTDQSNWHATIEGSMSISSGSWLTTTFAQLHEYLRLVITANSSGSAVSLDCRVIY